MTIETARAIEVCLSRLRMPVQTANMLAAALTQERSQPSQSPPRDPDEIFARLHVVLYHLDGPDEHFSKGSLLDRIRDARAELRQIIGTPHPAA